jgi:serine protease AprX
MTSPAQRQPSVHLRARVALATLAIAAVALVAPAVASAGALPRSLHRLAAAHPQQETEVIVQLTPGTALAHGRALVRAAGGRPGISLPIIDGLSARLPAAGARRLAADPRVRAVTPNARLRSQDYGGPQEPSRRALATNVDRAVGATRLWWDTMGQGVGVAVIDTGIAGDLPDFQDDDNQSRVVASAVIDPNATTADDTYGHGTAVAGMIAGNGDQRGRWDPSWGNYVGTAPDANLISIKIADDTGASTILDAIYGLQFAVDHQQEYNIRVINMSFRSTTAESYATDPLDAAAEQAWNHGIVVVAAAGNLGDAPDAVDYAPANDPYVLTVGATDTNGTADDSDDWVPSWSSQGTTQDGFTKPDVLAPGDHVITTLSPGSDFASECPSCIINNDYFQLSGTSLAAPVVSGIVADLAADHPGWSPDQIKGAIVDSANPIANGAGVEVDAAAADRDYGAPLADQNLTPSTMLDPGTGDIDYNAASWSAASWSSATDPLAASWSAASWSCEDCSAPADPTDGSGSGTGDTGGGVAPTAASWSSLGWASLFN